MPPFSSPSAAARGGDLIGCMSAAAGALGLAGAGAANPIGWPVLWEMPVIFSASRHDRPWCFFMWVLRLSCRELLKKRETSNQATTKRFEKLGSVLKGGGGALSRLMPWYPVLNYEDTKPLMSSLLVFNIVYRLKIQSVMLVSSTAFVNYCPSNLLSG